MNRQQAFLVLAIGLSATAAFLIVLPFLEYVLAAVVFAYVLYPIHRRLLPYLGSRLSPILLIGASLVVVAIPFLYVSAVLIRDLNDLARRGARMDLTEIEIAIAELTGLEVALGPALAGVTQEVLEVVFGSVPGFFSIALHTTLGAALLFFLVYYCLKDGARFVAWTIESSPLPRDVTEHLYARIDQTTRGVVIGHIFVAILQGLVGGVGLFVAGIPNYVFWTFVMIVLALLPLIGAFLIWAPAAGYLALIGQTEWGLFLAVYGVVVVSMIDNYARPIVIDQRAHLNPGIILVGVFGGVYAIGFTGLFVGPIVLGVLAATIVTFTREYDRLATVSGTGL